MWVSYGCLTSYHKLKSLKATHIRDLMVPLGQKSMHSLAASSIRVSHGCSEGGRWAVFLSGGGTGEGFASKLIQVVGRIYFLAAVEVMATCSLKASRKEV